MKNTNGHLLSTAHPDSSPVYIDQLSASPIGPLWVAASECGLAIVDWDMPQDRFTHLVNQRFHAPVILGSTYTSAPLQQLAEYLSGTRRHFDLALDLSGMSPFQRQVLLLTADIPYGQTTTYKNIATRMGNPFASRAVGRVEATNPLPLVIPCHRVLGSDGALHGYGGPGGIKMKSWLLQLEQGRG